jgi:ATP-binding cassette subfamily B (MDR/TAP) protein 1
MATAQTIGKVSPEPSVEPDQSAPPQAAANQGKPPSVKPWQLFRFAGPLDSVVLAFGILFAICNGLAMPYVAVVFGDSIDASAQGGSAVDAMQDVLVTFAYYCLVIAVFGALWQACFTFSSGRQIATMRKEYLRSVLYKDIAWFDVNQPAELPTRMQSEAASVQDGIGTKFGQVCMISSQFVGGLAVAFTRGSEGWKLSLVICGAIPLFIATGIYMAMYMSKATAEKQGAYARAGAIAEEVLMAIRTVASFGGEAREMERYHKQLAPAKTDGVKTGFHMGSAFGLVIASFAWMYALAFWFAVNYLEVSGAEVILVFFGVIIGVSSLSDLGTPATAISAAAASAGIMFPIIDGKATIEAARTDDNGATDQGLGDIQQIQFENVEFSYPARQDVRILKGLTLTISKGQKVALVGESGSGKSTAVQLLERFYDPISGVVKVNDKDLRQVSLQWWRNQIGYVGQEPVLFATTVFKNIAGNTPGMSEQDVIAAAKQAQAFDFLDQLPKKLDTYVGVGGGQMSGGQKQRIAIARALIRKPQILLLDEATSALDNESEKMVQQTIDQLQESSTGSLTTVSIAHRLSTIKNCSHIHFLKLGIVVESGTHSELMAKQGDYYAQVRTQEAGHEEEKKDSQASPLTVEEVNSSDVQAVTGVTMQEASKESDKKDETAGAEGKLERQVSPDGIMTDEEKMKARLEKLKEEKYSPPLGRLLQMSRPEWFAFPLAILGPLMSGSGMPLMGYLLSQAIGDFYIPVKDDRIDAINKWAMWFGILGVVVWIGEATKWTLFTFIQESLSLRLRDASFKAYLRQDVGYFDDPNNTPSGLTTLLEQQTRQVTNMTGISCGNAVGSIMGLVLGLVLAFIGSWRLALACLAAIPVVGIATSVVVVEQMGAQGGGDQYSQAGAIAAEGLLNIRTVRALSMESQSLGSFNIAVDAIAQKEGSVLRSIRKGIAFGLSNAALNGIFILGFWYGAELIDGGHITQGDMYQAMFCIMFGIFGASMSMAFAADGAKGNLAAYDIFALLDRESKVDALDPTGKFEDMGDGNIEFKGVTFHYPHRPELPVLKGLDFTVTKGQTVALVGPSGSGKSTVIQLLQRFYDPASGEILVGGTALTSFNITWWRRQVALVGQEPVLFDMSLEDNVKYGKPDATREEVEAAARKANMDYVFNNKIAWEDNVGIKGGKLSGGQKQRCAIARAILREPSVLLLDEATSALDSVSEMEVQKALDAARAGRTTFTIAHRLSTIQDSDVILVISAGKVVERGTHNELLQLQGVYSNLAKRGRE